MKVIVTIYRLCLVPFRIAWILMKVAGLHYRRLKNVYSTSKWTYEQKQKAHRAILAACTGGAGIKDGKMTIITIKDKKDENIYSN